MGALVLMSILVSYPPASWAADRTEGLAEVLIWHGMRFAKVCDAVTSRVGLDRFQLFYTELDGNTHSYGVHSGEFKEGKSFCIAV